jgi:hypothetical protein
MMRISDVFLLVELELEQELVEQPALDLQSLKLSEVRQHPLLLRKLQF